jgi:hypothetical protein
VLSHAGLGGRGANGRGHGPPEAAAGASLRSTMRPDCRRIRAVGRSGPVNLPVILLVRPTPACERV